MCTINLFCRACDITHPVFDINYKYCPYCGQLLQEGRKKVRRKYAFQAGRRSYDITSGIRKERRQIPVKETES